MTRCLDIHGDSLGCVGQSKCITHGLWHALGDHIRAFLNHVSLQDVIDGRLINGPGNLEPVAAA